jgi:hypothetical protein
MGRPGRVIQRKVIRLKSKVKSGHSSLFFVLPGKDAEEYSCLFLKLMEVACLAVRRTAYTLSLSYDKSAIFSDIFGAFGRMFQS